MATTERQKTKLESILGRPVIFRHPTPEEIEADPLDFDPPTLIVEEFKSEGPGKRVALVEIDDLFDHEAFHFEGWGAPLPRHPAV